MVIDEKNSKIILAFDADAKLIDFTEKEKKKEKLKTATGKNRLNLVTWSFLLFSANLVPNLFNIKLGQ